MSRLLADERGFSLFELLTAMTIMLIVVSATLVTLEQFTRGSQENQRRNESQDRARTAVDLMARDLRNLAGTETEPKLIEKAEPYELVFQAVDPSGPGEDDGNRANVQRVRYCVNTTEPTRVERQLQSWSEETPPPVPSTAECPDGAWGGSRAIALDVTNRADGRDRPLWTYTRTGDGEITSIGIDLYVDTDPDLRPGETRLTSGVFLRNQNRRPVASLTATPVGNRHVLLNGSSSEDPDGGTLEYEWLDLTANRQIGTSAVLDYRAPSTGPRSFALRVEDLGGLRAEAPPAVVEVR